MPISATPATLRQKRPLLNAALKLAVVFVISTLVLGGTLYLAMPPLDPEDRPLLHLPKSFQDLKALDFLLKKYKRMYPFRTVLCFVVVYLFDQAFSLPGSMYLSILSGAVWNPFFAVPLCCFCVATGSALCYLLSAALGPALLAMPKWAERVERFRVTLESQKANLFSFLIILRIAPLPPHWVTNILCPHLGVPLPFFWLSAFLGILAPTVIQVTIGGGLEQMTSPKDFHLLSPRNVLSLGAIVVAALVPVVLRWAFKDRVDAVAEVEATADVAAHGPRSPTISIGIRSPTVSVRPLSPYHDQPASPRSHVSAEPGIVWPPKGNSLLVLLKDDDDVVEVEEEDEDGHKVAVAGGVAMPEDQQGQGSRWRWLNGWWHEGVRLS
ncbi:hypothetical protein DACRYDRAFT_47785 [Dacryopinax primogenitus]|uniref:VTT domain-containing protein n=1 Tax=Dacryopinax primogenitus (strain DJM 731) TaxID=1858805 RepID=M5GG45_DACPD|nr:uncharacterized protein DACRYDRAFT_47785 [Dacryopinax primogenitus]EJU04848.1 hypothetical protein DACRYDRAFT_47785 [Dacryopinax primogenitus]